eukprot:GILI01008215.1.p1 GENE.GILI01008215.1~~GILI01008215.1.p1  ORF type:complete len:255 (-),score=67.48 GILI01008215.1:201-965(-)
MSASQHPHGSFAEGFLASWSMILASEIGDKTFFIACLMAMRYPKIVVFTGAIGALAAMTVLSSLMGVVVPNVLSVRFTQAASALLFLGFGIKILYSTITSDGEESEDEMAEAAAAIGRKRDDGSIEEGKAGGAKQQTVINRLEQIFPPVFIQAFVLTFLAEWGDRSQIATIVLAAAKDPYGVTLGGIVGHSICTGAAVLFGNLIASKISHKAINYTGGILFILFGVGTAIQLMMTSAEAPVVVQSAVLAATSAH